MAYCVHCGVELHRAEKECPLCQTVVQNPREPFDETAPTAWPTREDPVQKRLNRRFVACLISIILAFPAFLCLAIEWSMQSRFHWSLIVSGALLVVWAMIVPALVFPRIGPPGVLLVMTLAVALFLLQLAWMTGGDWFLPLALPLVLWVALVLLAVILLWRSKRVKKYTFAVALVVLAGLLTIGIDLILRLWVGLGFGIGWSIYSALSCFAVAAVGLAFARHRRVRDEIRKRLHY